MRVSLVNYVNDMPGATCVGLITCMAERDAGEHLGPLYADAGCDVMTSAATVDTPRTVAIDCRPLCGWDGGVQAGAGCCERFAPHAYTTSCFWNPPP